MGSNPTGVIHGPVAQGIERLTMNGCTDLRGKSTQNMSCAPTGEAYIHLDLAPRGVRVRLPPGAPAPVVEWQTRKGITIAPTTCTGLLAFKSSSRPDAGSLHTPVGLFVGDHEGCGFEPRSNKTASRTCARRPFPTDNGVKLRARMQEAYIPSLQRTLA